MRPVIDQLRLCLYSGFIKACRAVGIPIKPCLLVGKAKEYCRSRRMISLWYRRGLFGGFFPLKFVFRAEKGASGWLHELEIFNGKHQAVPAGSFAAVRGALRLLRHLSAQISHNCWYGIIALRAGAVAVDIHLHCSIEELSPTYIKVTYTLAVGRTE